VRLAELVSVARKVEATSSRNEKIRILTEFFSQLSPEEAEYASRLLAGRIFPEYDERSLGVGVASISEALEDRGRVSFLVPASKSVDIGELYELFTRISKTSSRQKKLSLLRYLFSHLSSDELDFVLRVIFGEVRVGAGIGILLEVAAKLSGCGLDDVRRAYMFLSDIGDVFRVALSGGCEGLRRVKITLFRPVKPMLASMAYSFKEILREHGGKSAVEYKYDGIRVQIHKDGDRIRVFSRRLSDITSYVPEVVQLAKMLPVGTAIIDGEAVGIDKGRVVSFQEISRRIRRKRDREKVYARIPLHVYLFDLLYYNGVDLTNEPYIRRRRILEGFVKEENLARMRVVDTVEEAEEVYKRAISEGHEGIVAKRLDGGYEPGTRGKLWLKYKISDTIDCVIVAAEWGHGRRRGWLSDYHLAVLDEREGRFVRVGKTYKGLTDVEFEEITKRLLQLKVREEDFIVYVKPEIVVEVEYAEIQKSRRYESGFALRFARIKRIRWDKSPWEITTLTELAERYEKQGTSKVISLGED